MCLGLLFLIIVQKPATHQPFIQNPALGVADNPLLEMLYLILIASFYGQHLILTKYSVT